MSRTLAEAEREVRYHLRDRNPQGAAFTSPEYLHAIQSAVRLLAGQLLLGETITPALITLVAGTKDYVLPGTQQYAKLYQLRSGSHGVIIPVVSMAHLESLRQGDTGTTVAGPPQVAAIYETTAQATTIRFWQTPAEADTLEGRFLKLPTAFYTAGTGALAALPDSTIIPFDDDGFEALCWIVAAEMYERMPEDKRARLGLGQGAGSSWPEIAAAHVKASRLRMLRLGAGQGQYVRRGRAW